jgi:hypothetical protein
MQRAGIAHALFSRESLWWVTTDFGTLHSSIPRMGFYPGINRRSGSNCRFLKSKTAVDGLVAIPLHSSLEWKYSVCGTDALDRVFQIMPNHILAIIRLVSADDSSGDISATLRLSRLRC